MANVWLRWIDLPPVWLLAALGGAYSLRAQTPVSGWFSQSVVQGMALALIVAGFGLMVAAVLELLRRKTTVIPHLEADHLVQTGIFRLSRNPIYLGDVVVLAGFILRWDVPVALVFVPLLIWVLRTRFILPEEARLRRKFGTAFDAYAARTRRWI